MSYGRWSILIDTIYDLKKLDSAKYYF